MFTINGPKLAFLAAAVGIPCALVVCTNLGARLAAVVAGAAPSAWCWPSWIWLATASWACVLVMAWAAGSLYRWWQAHVGPGDLAIKQKNGKHHDRVSITITCRSCA